jgi:hypothetical protein
MLTIQDFTAKYETYTDEELYGVLQDIDNYSAEAGKALDIVIDKRGGKDALIKKLEEKAVIQNEKNRIAHEATKLGLGGVDASFVKNTTSSTILSKEEVDKIIEHHVEKAELEVEDKKVNFDTIVKSLVACALAAIPGGLFASIQFLYFGATSRLMLFGTALICYGTVKLITKKSYNNTAVLLATVAAFILSNLLAALALEIFGYLG